MKNLILIADDEPNIRLMLRTCLETDGFNIVEAADGKAALAAVGKHAPDLMILDLWMPPPGGMVVLQTLHDENKLAGMRVIVLTAHGSISAAVQALKLGAFDFLEKPITPDPLRLAVARAYEDPRALDLAPEPDRDLLLCRVRTALRLNQLDRAEAQLLKIATVYADDPEYLNLVGVFHEKNCRFKDATHYYGKAFAANTHYQPAHHNLHRLKKLEESGHSETPYDLG